MYEVIAINTFLLRYKKLTFKKIISEHSYVNQGLNKHCTKIFIIILRKQFTGDF